MPGWADAVPLVAVTYSDITLEIGGATASGGTITRTN